MTRPRRPGRLRVEWSPEALADLEAVDDYIAQDDPEAARAWRNRLLERAEKAAGAPGAGRMVPEFKDPAVREVLLRTYRIVYRVEPKRLYVLTVFEGHRLLRGLPRR